EVILPGLGGVSLARRVRRQGNGTGVILISGFYADVDLPGVRFVRKPIDSGQLLRVVRRVFGEGEGPPRPGALVIRPGAGRRAGAGSGSPRSRGRLGQTVYK